MTVFRRRRPRALLALGVTVVVLVTGAATEAVLRHRLTARVSDRVEESLGTEPDVSLGATPALWQLTQGSFSHVEVSGSDASYGELSGLAFDADLNGVRQEAGGLAVDGSRVRTVMSKQALADSVVRMTGGSASGQPPAVTTDPGSSELVLHTGPGQLVSVAMCPESDGDEIRLERDRVLVAGQSVPDETADRLLGDTPVGVDLSGLPLGLKPSGLSVTDQGLRVDLEGGPATARG